MITEIFCSTFDWVIKQDNNNVKIHPKFADDISFIRSDQSKINQIERLLPGMLKENNLILNEDKTEKFHVNIRNTDSSWKRCKYLRSLLGTEEDIKRRKGLVIETFNTLEYMFKSKNLSEKRN